jgi:hypothetical protein
MIRIYEFFFPPDQERQFLAILNGTGVCSVLPMERKGVFRDSDFRVMRVTGHLEGPEDAFQRMEEQLTEQGFQFTVDLVVPNVRERPSRRRRKQLLKGFKSQVKEQERVHELEQRTLPDRIIMKNEFLDVATCMPDSAMPGEPPIPVDRDQYTVVDALVCLVAAMSGRYGLDQRRVREACRFLASFDLEELNAELRAGRTFVIVPTNRKPRLIDQSMSLIDLRNLCGHHGYPGLLLDIAVFVDDVRAGLQKLDDRSR